MGGQQRASRRCKQVALLRTQDFKLGQPASLAHKAENLAAMVLPGAHAGAGTAGNGVAEGEALQAVAVPHLAVCSFRESREASRTRVSAARKSYGGKKGLRWLVRVSAA